MADGQMNQNPPQSTDTARNWLALSVSILSILVILILAMTIIVGAAADKRGDDVKFVLTAVLPLVGSWVGTILAYFFSSESLRAATNSVATLTQQLTSQDRLRSIAVRDKMIKRADVKAVETQPLDKVKVVDAKQTLDAAKVNRLLVLDTNDYPRLVIHRSIIDRYLASKSLATPPPPNLTGLTLKDMLDDPEFKSLLSSTYETVRESATLAEAKEMMDQTPNCQDVFVTRTGSRSEPVFGWITNVIIEENSKV